MSWMEWGRPFFTMAPLKAELKVDAMAFTTAARVPVFQRWCVDHGAMVPATGNFWGQDSYHCEDYNSTVKLELCLPT